MSLSSARTVASGGNMGEPDSDGHDSLVRRDKRVKA
jgi:hypothetical protein